MSAVVLLHAFPCDHTLWSGQVERLRAAGWRVFAPDIPGFGGTGLLNAPPGLGIVAQGILDGYGAEPIHVVGLSLGGYLAMEMLRRDKERIASLVLIDTKASDDDEVARNRRLAMADAVERAGSCESLVDSLLPMLIGPTSLGERPDVVERVECWIRSAPAETVAWYQRAMAARPDSHATLADATIPITIVWGDEDVMSLRSDQMSMLNAASHASFIEVSKSGHLSAIERRDPVTEALLRHLEEQQPR